MPNFIKTGPPDAAARFAAEAEGLAALAATGTVRVPAVVGHGLRDGRAYIELERLDLHTPTAAAAAALGKRLAALHRHFGDAHGWDHDGWLGLAPQRNARHDDWPTFFAEQRLGFQVQWAHDNGYGGRVTRAAERLIARLPAILDHAPRPSLLHGDFWSGNHGMLADGTPVVFDPAVHYGDRECDLAMAALFGGFHADFFDAYVESWPMHAGWQARWKVYQLYHVLNHLNLFGEAYLTQADALLAELD